MCALADDRRVASESLSRTASRAVPGAGGVRRVSGSPYCGHDAQAARRWVVGTIAFLLGAVVLPGESWAFVRTTTCFARCDDSCVVARDGVCSDGGPDASDDACELGTDCSDCGYRAAPGSSPLHCAEGEQPIPITWPGRCVGFHVHQDGATDIAFERVSEIIDESFETWSSVECSYLELIRLGETDETRPGYSVCGPNTNFVGFVESGWRDRGYPRNAIALTSVTFDTRTGLVVDADIELNADDWTFIEIPEDRSFALQDLQNTLTHEIGHFVGLDHTTAAAHVGEGSFRDATMFETSPVSETSKRVLHEDDRAGICDAYPVEEVDRAAPCEVEGEGFFERSVNAPGAPCTDPSPTDPGSGSAGRTRESRCTSASGGATLFGIPLIALLLTRRRATA